MSSGRTYTSFDDMAKKQMDRINILNEATCILFGYDTENRELARELNKDLQTLSSGIQELKSLMSVMKDQNTELQAAIEKAESCKQFLEEVENNPDFQRLFGSSQEREIVIPSSIPRTARKTPRKVLSIQNVSASEYENIPFYAKGRIKLEEINDFIRSANTTITKKYTMIQNRNLKFEERGQVIAYKQQEKSCPGATFFTEDDLKKFGNFRPTVALNKLLSILRLTRRLKEVRSDGLVYYVVM